MNAIYEKLDCLLREGNVLLAIEGGSGSGKTTLAAQLAKFYGGNVFHMDDFFLRPTQRTDSRYAEAGGNVDRERFLEEVLLPASRQQTVTYQPFDCNTQTLMPLITVAPAKLTVIEGAYSMHPALADYYDFSVFLDISPALQEQRIRKRNTPQKARLFFSAWIPMENRYFRELQVKERCNLVIPVHT